MADIFKKMFESEYFIYILIGLIIVLVALFFIVLFSGKKPKKEKKVEEPNNDNSVSNTPVAESAKVEPVEPMPEAVPTVEPINEVVVPNVAPTAPLLFDSKPSEMPSAPEVDNLDKTIEFSPNDLNMINNSNNVVEDVKSNITFEPFPTTNEPVAEPVITQVEQPINTANQFSSVYINNNSVASEQAPTIDSSIPEEKVFVEQSSMPANSTPRIDDDEPIFKVVNNEDDDMPKLK